MSSDSSPSEVLYEAENSLATITINRPLRLNSFPARAVDHLTDGFKRARPSTDFGAIRVVDVSAAVSGPKLFTRRPEAREAITALEVKRKFDFSACR